MQNGAIWAAYEARLRRVSSHIYEHLDEDLDMDRLAEIACLSPYHWHRIYRAVHGETPAATVKRLRLHRAAGELAQTSKPVSEVARRCGYPNLQSFNRIFSSVYGMPPARYRSEGSHRRFRQNGTKEPTIMYDVTIRSFPSTALIGIPHRGSYMNIGEAFGRLYGTLHARGIFDQQSRMLGIYLDDPETVAEGDLRSFACVTANAPSQVEPLLEAPTIDEGECAVLRHQGPYADMRSAYQWLYGDWLRQSGREVRDQPVFEIYLNNPRDVQPTELLTEIWLPLK
jgi:AraC family transcriptional regulator